MGCKCKNKQQYTTTEEELLAIFKNLKNIFFVNFDTDEPDILIAYKCPYSGNPVVYKTPDIDEVIEHFKFFLHPEDYLKDEIE